MTERRKYPAMCSLTLKHAKRLVSAFLSALTILILPYHVMAQDWQYIGMIDADNYSVYIDTKSIKSEKEDMLVCSAKKTLSPERVEKVKKNIEDADKVLKKDFGAGIPGGKDALLNAMLEGETSMHQCMIDCRDGRFVIMIGGGRIVVNVELIPVANSSEGMLIRQLCTTK